MASSTIEAEERDPPKQGLKQCTPFVELGGEMAPRSEIHQNKD